jgi:hypothetical protein
MSSLSGSKSRHLGATSSSPTSSHTKAPSVIDARNVGDSERYFTADSDGDSDEGARRTSADATASPVDDNVRGAYAAALNTGEAQLGSAGTDTADMPRRAAIVYTVPSKSITAKSVMSSAPSRTAAPQPPLPLTDASMASSKLLYSPARRCLVLFSAVGGGVLGAKLLRHSSGLVIKVFGVVVGTVRHIAQKVLGRVRCKYAHRKENSQQNAEQYKKQPVRSLRRKGELRLTGGRKSFKF